MIPKAQDTVFASQGAFTSCDTEVPHYRFQAGEIKLVNQDVIRGVARGAVREQRPGVLAPVLRAGHPSGSA